MRTIDRVTLAAVATLLACAQASPLGSEQTAPTARAFDRSSLDTTCAPCRDFFQFANGGWLARTEIPAAFPSWGSFDELHVRNMDVLRVILERAAKDGTTAPGSTERKLGVFYGSCLDSAGTEAVGVGPIQAELQRIAQVASVADVQAEVARLQRLGIPALFAFTSGQDAKHSTEMIAEARQGGLGSRPSSARPPTTRSTTAGWAR